MVFTRLDWYCTLWNQVKMFDKSKPATIQSIYDKHIIGFNAYPKELEASFGRLVDGSLILFLLDCSQRKLKIGLWIIIKYLLFVFCLFQYFL